MKIELSQQKAVIRMGLIQQASFVRMIQKQRDEEPCFSTSKRYHCTEQCEWRNDCIKPRAV